MSRNWQEKRREARRVASGPVKLVLQESFEARIVHGSLLDISDHGFRAAHGFSGLTSGQDVVFEHEGRHGRARVAWTRVTQEGVESGFFLLAG
ncbi:MAG: hypothetical protein ACOYX1_04695 [Acidobacteriota bacterium]